WCCGSLAGNLLSTGPTLRRSNEPRHTRIGRLRGLDVDRVMPGHRHLLTPSPETFCSDDAVCQVGQGMVNVISGYCYRPPWQHFVFAKTDHSPPGELGADPHARGYPV